MPLTIMKLARANWQLVYEYSYNDKGACFKTFADKKLPGITITHDRKVGSTRTIIYYTVNRRRTDSPSQACKIYNEMEKKNGSTTPVK